MKSLAQYFKERESARRMVRKAVRKRARTGHVMSPNEQSVMLRRVLPKLDA